LTLQLGPPVRRLAAAAVGILFGASARAGLYQLMPMDGATAAHPSDDRVVPCVPQGPGRASTGSPPASNGDVPGTSDADEWAAALRRSSTWFEGLPQDWTDELLADPRWGPDAVALAVEGWQEESPLPLDLVCDEYPCMVVVDERSYLGEDDIGAVVIGAFRRSGHMPPDIFYAFTGWGFHVYGVAPSQELREAVGTRFFWRAELEMAKRGVPEAIKGVQTKDPNIDLGIIDLGIDTGTQP